MPPAPRRRLVAAFVCAALGVGPAGVATAQVGLPPNRLNDVHNDPTGIFEIPAARVARFSLRGNDLAVASEMTLADGTRQFRVRGLEGLTRVKVDRQVRRATGFSPFFELTYDGLAAQTSVYAQGGTVRLGRSVRVGDNHTTVSFDQDSPTRRGRPVEPNASRVTLRVRTTNVSRPQAPSEDLRVSADSFVELLLQHPGPAARHLAPLFRDFGQDAVVFRVDPRVAWQLFPDADDADEATVSRARSLLARLDSHDFRQRELATAELEVLGGPAIGVLGEADRWALSAEQIARIDAILARFNQLSDAEVTALLDNTEFLLRCFTYSELQPIRVAAVREIERKIGMETGLSPAAKLTERIRAADQMRERVLAGS